MRPSRSLGTELWREIVERLNEGVILFNQHGVAIYANDEAARLLDYNPRDVLELEKDDLAALIDPDRLDGARFVEALLAKEMPAQAADRPYEIVTTKRRIAATPQAISLEHGTVTLLLIRELASWRSELIARTVASDLQGPLAVVAHYADVLINRLGDGSTHPYELQDLSRIIKESLAKAMSVWQMLAQLHNVDPKELATQLAFEKVDMSTVLRLAVSQVEQQAASPLPMIRLEVPADLPAAKASANLLHPAISVLIEQAASALPVSGSLTISAEGHDRHVQVNLRAEPEGSSLKTHLFDVFPLANAEQTIMRCGGRVWTDNKGRRVSFSLPLWEPKPDPFENLRKLTS